MMMPKRHIVGAGLLCKPRLMTKRTLMIMYRVHMADTWQTDLTAPVHEIVHQIEAVLDILQVRASKPASKPQPHVREKKTKIMREKRCSGVLVCWERSRSCGSCWIVIVIVIVAGCVCAGGDGEAPPAEAGRPTWQQDAQAAIGTCREPHLKCWNLYHVI
jgi:hypothetical protein